MASWILTAFFLGLEQKWRFLEKSLLEKKKKTFFQSTWAHLLNKYQVF